MSARTKTERRNGRLAKDGLVPASSDGSVADGRGRKEVPPLGKAARVRSSMSARFDDWRTYAKFAVDGGFDIADGESIERFGAIGKLDERTLRIRGQELREAEFKRDIQLIAERQKRITN